MRRPGGKKDNKLLYGEASYDSLLSHQSKKAKSNSRKAIITEKKNSVASLLERTDLNTSFEHYVDTGSVSMPFSLHSTRTEDSIGLRNISPLARDIVSTTNAPQNLLFPPNQFAAFSAGDIFACASCPLSESKIFVLEEKVRLLNRKDAENVAKIERLEYQIDQCRLNRDLEEKISELTKPPGYDKLRNLERAWFQENFKNIFKSLYLGLIYAKNPYPMREAIINTFNDFVNFLKECRFSDCMQLGKVENVTLIINYLNMKEESIESSNATGIIKELSKLFKDSKDFHIQCDEKFWNSATHYIGKIRLQIISTILEKVLDSFNIPKCFIQKKRVFI